MTRPEDYQPARTVKVLDEDGHHVVHIRLKYDDETGMLRGFVAESVGIDIDITDERSGLYYVNEYLTGQGYGGPEEGGWWYGRGRFVMCRGIYTSKELAEDRCDRLAEYVEQQNEYCYKPHSTMNNDDWTVLLIQQAPGADYPQKIPHYE